jgi:hypothetical protein
LPENIVTVAFEESGFFLVWDIAHTSQSTLIFYTIISSAEKRIVVSFIGLTEKRMVIVGALRLGGSKPSPDEPVPYSEVPRVRGSTTLQTMSPSKTMPEPIMK